MFQVCYMSATRGSKNQPLKQILLLLEAEASGENAATRSAKLDAQPNIGGLHYPCNTIVASTRDLQGGDPRFLPAVRCRSSSRPPQLPPARRRSRTPAASAPAGLASGASVPRHPSPPRPVVPALVAHQVQQEEREGFRERREGHQGARRID